MLLPRRSYTPVLGRLLHDRTADRMARVISRVPNAAATIIPFDTEAHLRGRTLVSPTPKKTAAKRADPVKQVSEPQPPPDCNPIGGCHLASKCGTCNVCTDCDGCYCNEGGDW